MGDLQTAEVGTAAVVAEKMLDVAVVPAEKTSSVAVAGGFDGPVAVAAADLPRDVWCAISFIARMTTQL